MKGQKVKKPKFDISSLKFALVVLTVAYLYDFVRQLNYRSKAFDLKQKSVCLSIGIISASANHAQRIAIREGWGRSQEICRLKFFIATSNDWNLVQKVQSEGYQYNDIVLVQVAESYYNITHQTLDIFKTLTIDPQVTHVMKVDDDSYVRMDLLINFLRDNEDRFKGKDTFTGYLEPISGPIRDVNSKWYMGHSDWPYDYYPIWAHGAGYILSVNLARAIGNSAASLSLQKKILHLEDVSTGIWIDYVKESFERPIEMIHDTRFNFFPSCLDTDFISHYASPELQACLEAKKKCDQCIMIS